MNARKAILVLGIVAVAIIAALVTVAVLFHKKMETERNQARTAPMRKKRWEGKITPGGGDQVEPDQEIEVVEEKQTEQK